MIGTTLNGRFTLEGELGRGGMGSVYRATDLVLNRRVAIKILRGIRGEEVARKIRLEAQILARLVHPGIVRLYDLNLDDETYYFVMEEVDGPSFRVRGPQLEVPARLRVLLDLCDALDYAHHQGVIHRDVKPANVLMTPADEPKLSDFGLSTRAGQVQETGVARGTPIYMSPEQATGSRVDHRTDLYSLGVMLYECLTGTTPFRGSPTSVMALHVHEPPEPPSRRVAGLAREVEWLTLSLLSKTPAGRPASAREAGERLRDLVARGRVFDEATSRAGAALVGAGWPGDGTGSRASAGGATPVSGSSGIDGRGLRLVEAGPPPAEGSPGAGERGRAMVARIVDAVAADPITLTPDERYLCGHYLAYLLGGSRRRGFLLRRPLDPLNADRARLMLAMAALCLPEGSGITVGLAAELLEERPDCRPALSPVVVMKYLAGRGSPTRRKRFRQLRSALQQSSEYAARHLTDDRGVLNPGLMPQALDDLRRVAPRRVEVDDELVHRWNQVADVWRGNPEFRRAVLRYATTGAWRDPASVELWPEVVYPLIERARRQRRLRSGVEVLWDAVSGHILHVGDAGPRLDRAISRAVPPPVVRELDDSQEAVLDEFQIEESPRAEMDLPEPGSEPDGSGLRVELDPNSFADLQLDEPDRRLIRLAPPDPVRLTLGELRALWQEAVAVMRSARSEATTARLGHKPVPVGPYRLTVIATIRSRAAGQVAIQGMPNKQIEMIVPSFAGAGSASRPILAAWTFEDHSLAVTYLDNLDQQRFILWDASLRRQTNFDDPASLNHALFQLGLEGIESLSEVLTKRYRSGEAV